MIGSDEIWKWNNSNIHGQTFKHTYIDWGTEQQENYSVFAEFQNGRILENEI